MSITSNCLPPDREPTNGYCVRLVNLVGDRELCQELSWFWGRTAELDAAARFHATLKGEALDDLPEGKYRLTIYPAWRGNEREPASYDDTTQTGRATFLLKRVTTIEHLTH